MKPQSILLLSVSLSLLFCSGISPNADAQGVPGMGGVIQAQQMMIEEQKKKDEEKAKADAEAAAKKEAEERSADSPLNKKEEITEEAKKDDAKKDDAKKDDAHAGEAKKAEEHKPFEKKEEKKDEKDEKNADAKTEEEKKAEQEKKAEEERKAAESDKKLFSSTEKYDPIKHAVFAIQNGRAAEGVGLLRQALEKNPNHWQAHYLLGYAYVMQRKFNEAAEEYRKVISGAPNTPLGKMAQEGLVKLAK